MSTHFRYAPLPVIAVGLFTLVLVAEAPAANQTTTLSPVVVNGALPYHISVEPYDFGAAALPTLQSFDAAQYGGKWVLIGGRTNGLHGFDSVSANNFPAAFQNREVWVIDPVTKQSWHRSLDDPSSGLTTDEVNSLTPTNTQFCQTGDRLYVTGGYGIQQGTQNTTFDALSAIDLPGIVDWATGGAGTAKQYTRQIHDPMFQVTGGVMEQIAGRTHLVFGQYYPTNYIPNQNGTYTNQVRSFDIVDDGTTLSVANASATTPDVNYRRRDLNIVPLIRPSGGGQTAEGMVALSGVFTPTNGAWTVPVEIDAAGHPTMADPTSASTFKQGMNGYQCASLGLYSASSQEMHEILFGGISLQYLDGATNQIVTDNQLPFVNDISSIVIDAAGHYTEHRIGEFPTITDLDGHRLRFGAASQFFTSPSLDAFDNGVLKLDSIEAPTTVGYIFGGIVANAPQTRNVQGAASAASNMIFHVTLTPVPEPGAWGMLLVAVLAFVRPGRGSVRPVF